MWIKSTSIFLIKLIFDPLLAYDRKKPQSLIQLFLKKVIDLGKALFQQYFPIVV